MNDRTAALGFLVARTVRNRFARQLARVRTPRYAVALLIGLAYFWLVFFRPGSVGSANRPNTGGAIASLGGIGFAITAWYWWLRGGVANALAFQPAEVQFLFPAPLSRRTLLAYRIVRAQILILINATIWMVLMRRWGIALNAPERFVTAWGLFSTLSLHRLAAALTQTAPVTGVRRVVHIAMQMLSGAAFAALAIAAFPGLRTFGSVGIADGMRALVAALAQPPASYALAPFRLISAPLSAVSPEAWLRAVGIVVVIIVAHVAWVMSLANVAFEEAAATASAEMARRIAAFKERRAGGGVATAKKVKRTWVPLAPTGWPATAVIWKNTLSLTRAGSLRVVIVLIALAIVSARLVSDAGTSGLGPAVPFLVFAGLIGLLGPRLVRNDLRQDLLHLALLRTWPLRGPTMVAAQMASPTIVLTVFQLGLVAAACAAVPMAVLDHWGHGTLIAALVAVPLVSLALNAANVAIQNGAALMFPTWVRLGADSGGIEAIGQNLLMMIGSMVALVLCLIGPVAAAGVVRTLMADLGPVSFVAAAAVAAVALGLETYAMVLALGNLFERTDPTAIA